MIRNTVLQFLLAVSLLSFAMGNMRLNAQTKAPGYVGKRFTASYGLFAGPAFSGATYSDRYWNQLHEISLQYATSERWQLGFSTRAFRTLYDNKRYLESERTNPSSFYKLNGAGFILSLRHYKPRYVAPWGKYFEFGLVVNVVRANYDPFMHVRKQFNNRDTLLFDFGPSAQTFVSPDLIFGWGRTRIIKDKFVIDYGWNACVLASLGLITDNVKANNTTYTFENYIPETYKERLNGVNRFNLYLRLGYLF